MVNSLTGMDVAKEEVLSIPLPSYCCFVVSLKCLMKCKMCYIWGGNEDYSKELSIQEWKHAAKSLQGLLDTRYDVILSGGEPLLKKGVLDLVSSIAGAGYRVSLETNAYLIDKELAKAIRDSGLWRICISLDSLDEDKHDFLRGRKDSYRRVMKAIEYLHNFSPRLGINIQTTIMNQNLDELVRLAEWVEHDKRLEYIYFQAIVQPFGSSQGEGWFQNPPHNFLWPDDLSRANSVIEELIELRNTNSKIVNTDSQFKMYAKYFEDPVGFSNGIDCSIGDRDINVNPQGEVYLCFSKDPIGNIKNNSFEEIWASQKAREVRNEIKKCKKYCHFLLNCSFEDKDCCAK